jgi:hypothetical protein
MESFQGRTAHRAPPGFWLSLDLLSSKPLIVPVRQPFVTILVVVDYNFLFHDQRSLFPPVGINDAESEVDKLVLTPGIFLAMFDEDVDPLAVFAALPAFGRGLAIVDLTSFTQPCVDEIELV